MKAKVIMLDTKVSNGLIFIGNWDHLHYNKETKVEELDEDEKFVNIHLIDESAEIKIGDHYTNGKNIFKCDNTTTVDKKRYSYLSKIIASTENLSHIIHDDTVPYPKGEQIIVPKLSDNSVQLLINHYNKNGKMSDEVEVEYENYWEDYKGRITTDESKKVYRQYGIKLNPQGTVDIIIPEAIKVIEKQNCFPFSKCFKEDLSCKDSDKCELSYIKELLENIAVPEEKIYSKEEVETKIKEISRLLIAKAHIDWHNDTSNGKHGYEGIVEDAVNKYLDKDFNFDVDKWIKQNL